MAETKIQWAASARATTSSRHPGRVFEGVVRKRRNVAVQCSVCGGYLLQLGPDDAATTHRTVQSRRDGRWYEVDCRGVELREAAL